MSDSDCLYIAQRMSALLARELGEGIDSKRMVAQPLYARDVLLVCQALRDTGLPELAREFVEARDGIPRAPATAPAAAAAPAARTSGATSPATLPASSPVAPAAPAARAAAPDTVVVPPPDSQGSEVADSAPPTGWRASLWPATMRGSLFGGLSKNRKRGPAPRG